MVSDASRLKPGRRVSPRSGACGSVTRRLIFSISVTWLTMAAPSSARELQLDSCYVASLSSGHILWAADGVALEGSSLRDSEKPAVLIADPKMQKIYRISPSGKMSSLLPETGPGDKSEQPLVKPASVRRAADGQYLVADEMTGRIMTLDAYRDRDPVGQELLDTKRLSSEGRSISRTYDWEPLGQGVLAFADVMFSPEVGAPAFVYIEGSNITILHELAERDEVRNQYHRNLPYLASLNGRGYVLFLDRWPVLGRVDEEHDSIELLPEFPEDFRYRPPLVRNPRWKGPRQATEFYRIFEQSTMVAGIYADSQHLYLVGKGPSAANWDTEWWLIEIDPDSGSEVARSPLPTTAPNLTVVPGDEWWALIEKGPVLGLQPRDAPFMSTTSIVTVGRDWLADRSSRTKSFDPQPGPSIQQSCVELD